MADARLRAARHVRIRSYRTAYWRFHTRGVPSDGLCTIEAVYFLCREARAGGGCRRRALGAALRLLFGDRGRGTPSRRACPPCGR